MNARILSPLSKIQVLATTPNKKSEYTQPLAQLDTALQDFFTKHKYQHPELTSLFPETTEERLQQAQAKLNAIPANPSVAISEVVKARLSPLRNFLQQYHIGFLQEAVLNEHGVVKVTIPCTITAGFSVTDTFSREQIFKRQIEFLKNEGFELQKNKLVNCAGNAEKITRLLQERGATGIQISTWHETISTVSFFVKLDALSKFDAEPFTYHEPKTDVVNSSERATILKAISEIKGALDAMSFMDDANIPMSIIESYFAILCETLEYSGVIYEQHEARYAEEVAHNKKIAEISNQLGDALSNEELTATLMRLKTQVSEYAASTVSCYVQDIAADKDGFITLNMATLVDGRWLDLETPSTSELNKFVKTHNTGNGRQILNTDTNIIMIENILNHVCKCEITSAEITRKEGKMCLSKFKVNVITPFV